MAEDRAARLTARQQRIRQEPMADANQQLLDRINALVAAIAIGKPKYVVVCPITGSAISSGSIPSFLVVRSSSANSTDGNGAGSMPNVLSEQASKKWE